MSSLEEREKGRKKRNRIAQVLRDSGDLKGAFSLKIIKPKTTYKREKLNPRNIELEQTEE